MKERKGKKKKKGKNIYCKITGQREADIAIKAKVITRDKEEYFVMIKGLIQREV